MASSDFQLPLGDLWLICKRSWRLILFCALFMGGLGMFRSLTKPTRYLATASFRDKEKSSAGISSSFMDLLGGSKGKNSEAASILTSRSLMEEAILKNGLQASIRYSHDRTSSLQQAWRNLRSEWAVLTGQKKPLFAREVSPLKVTEVCMSEELPVSFGIFFLDDHRYQVIGEDGDILSTACLGETVQVGPATFQLDRHDDRSLEGASLSLSFAPLHRLADSWARRLIIMPDDDDPSLLKLEFSYHDRFLAADFLNQIMDLYHQYQKDQSQKKTDIQLGYLERRQKEGRAQLEALMEDHAVRVSDSLRHHGILDAEKEMAFLAQAHKEHQRRMLEIDLETKRLQQAKSADLVVYDRCTTSCSDPLLINNLLNNIRALRQQRDSLELAMHPQIAPSPPKDLGLQLARIRGYQKQIEELEMATESLREGKAPPEFAQAWLQDWDQGLLASLEPSGCPPSPEVDQKHLLQYLQNMQRLTQVQKDAAEERLTHLQRPSDEFAGMDLSSVKKLTQELMAKLAEAQSSHRQYAFALQRLQQDSLELSALSPVMTDPICKELMKKAFEILSHLEDAENRSQKEQERLRGALSLIRRCLTKHVEQSLAIFQESEKLLEGKLDALKGVTLDLIHQEISMKEKQLEDYVFQRTENLRQERAILQERMDEMAQDLALLPEKWVSEKLVQQQLAQNQRVVEELTKLVESKNLTHNLEIIQSAPVDAAVVPLLPASPRFLVLTLAGLVFGTLVGLCMALFQGLLRGMPATKGALELAGEKVFGSLSPQAHFGRKGPMEKPDTQTLRRMAAHLKHKRVGKRVVVNESLGPHFTPHLADYLAARGERALLVELDFNLAADPLDLPGLLQYLQGEATSPKVYQEGMHWRIAAGGMWAQGTELLGKPQFDAYLCQMEDEYDWILLVCRQSFQSAEAEAACHHAQQLIVSLPETTMEALKGYRGRKDLQSVAFVFQEN